MKMYKSGVELTLEMKSNTLQMNMAALWAIEQEGFVIQMGDKLMGVDLYLTNSIRRRPMDTQVPS